MAETTEPITFQKLPTHIAIIMDDKCPWAEKGICRAWRSFEQARKSPYDHQRGRVEFGVKVLTVYEFLTEKGSARKTK